ncbi:DUF1330 domain-containing protein [Sulfitobacter sabulilitoris]|uniref:DUF1330 domain-containing protein n=1 Tax=Sulfitobacter sabulilitoris TaxID=2562655 RepID=A0A5S3Q340_9RHOB|nr:DUF1330 domain-containing protein [Sulfitobacter sabulilitoris]TMM50839.1 DUF1330 domain-containing protein [Sulfitobacter sabulilitoris]
MTKGYWIAHVDVRDPQAYDAYRAANAAPFKAYGAKFLVRGGDHEIREGRAKPRTVVIEFPSYAEAIACYESPAYQAAKALRDPVSEGDLLIIEGYDP